MDARQQRGLEIAAKLRIICHGSEWTVPSQNTTGKKYVVTVAKVTEGERCTCPDWELRGQRCKHLYAVQYVMEREENADGTMTARELITVVEKVTRPTYRQNWPKYNAAQIEEKDRLQAMLAELCGHIEEPEPKKGPGRKPVPLRDQAFAACFKIYSGFSARRFSCDVKDAHERGYLTRAMHFNSVLNGLENPAMTPILYDMIETSALPLRAVESVFAVDSTGFTTSRHTKWFDVKYGEKTKADWVDMKEVTADKVYACNPCFQAVADVGSKLYAPFKVSATGQAGGLYRQAFLEFNLRRDEYLAHYHQRSNVESTYSMVKRKFGDSVRSKTDTAMRNEVLAKFVCHNLCCLISAWHELGIESEFAPREPAMIA